MAAKKILIAEDDEAIASALMLKLKIKGYDVTQADNGASALEEIKSNKYDMVLLDIVMPEMDGFEVLAGLKGTEIKAPIIVTSNLSQEEDIQKAKDLGATDYLVKANSTLVDIINYVEKHLG